ncbi:MAG TPA: ribbon-helix-helix protein, CopG family [Candidatus Bathyarchaeota archaeon]|nr:ribbon-helix-helix protein, CopG family [Candidatus Bathyarchaeota archaeon]
MRRRNERISISISPEVLEVVELEASRQNRSRSNLIETILRQHLDAIPRPKRYRVDEMRDSF